MILGPNFTGWGNRPDFTPAHHVDFPTGTGPSGARIAGRRSKRSAGAESKVTRYLDQYEGGALCFFAGPRWPKSDNRNRSRCCETEIGLGLCHINLVGCLLQLAPDSVVAQQDARATKGITDISRGGAAPSFWNLYLSKAMPKIIFRKVRRSVSLRSDCSVGLSDGTCSGAARSATGPVVGGSSVGSVRCLISLPVPRSGEPVGVRKPNN